GAVLGLAFAWVVSLVPILQQIIHPFFVAFYGIPKIALAPLIIMWQRRCIWQIPCLPVPRVQMRRIGSRLRVLRHRHELHGQVSFPEYRHAWFQ
ncbi:MAG: hypothetical protein L0312_28445, partial [Acidobacteria bacterium]|nr:hypothetical protein [Acidobacteriota bacterium]